MLLINLGFLKIRNPKLICRKQPPFLHNKIKFQSPRTLVTPKKATSKFNPIRKGKTLDVPNHLGPLKPRSPELI